jgi:hypothetical protein
MRIIEGCRLGLNRLLMRVGNGTGKGTSGVDKTGMIDRMHMELGGSLIDSLKIRTQILERLPMCEC